MDRDPPSQPRPADHLRRKKWSPQSTEPPKMSPTPTPITMGRSGGRESSAPPSPAAPPRAPEPPPRGCPRRQLQDRPPVDSDPATTAGTTSMCGAPPTTEALTSPPPAGKTAAQIHGRLCARNARGKPAAAKAPKLCRAREPALCQYCQTLLVNTDCIKFRSAVVRLEAT
jgi:hypothetical protein